MEEEVDKLGNIIKEFKDKVDFCLSANIPVPPFDVNFFNLRSYFMAGPVPLSLGNYTFNFILLSCIVYFAVTVAAALF